MTEVQILRNLTNNQREQVASFEEQSKIAINKMTDLQAELDKRIGLITNIDQTLQEKDEKIITLKKKVEQWRTERYEFAAETDSVKDRLAEANKTIETLKRDLVRQDEAV
jgi:conjugal transfer/entry exclusion protein